MANQLALTFRRAAVLCGAPSVEATPTRAATLAPNAEGFKPASGASPSMSNSNVVELVAAGLSEQVIITAIRQAPIKIFDLTSKGLLALKKAAVTDPVLVAMQDSATQMQPTAKVADVNPKYDPSLAKLQNRASPAAQGGVCPGIQLMGLYKNEIFDRAKGGGIVEWLAKVRNNSSVTKVVTIGWRDSNGQQQKAQVQIRGGEIASPRLDMTQTRFIAPVADISLLSCE